MDLGIVGAGAAGLAAGIFAARRGARVTIFDGAAKIGAKILISGGGRCNVTNAAVTEKDFWGGSSNVVRRVLKAFPVERTRAFFQELGVSLHEEEDGKLFPDTHSARTVLEALLREAERTGKVLPGHRVTRVRPGFPIVTSRGEFRADRVILATGGKSLPKTGSDGGGYALAEALGHSIVPTTPGLDPLLLDGDFHVALSGISHEVELSLGTFKVRGPMLWTHFGISGPAALNLSRHWHRSPGPVTANLLPGRTFESADRLLQDTPLKRLLPARVAEAVIARLGVNPKLREDRRKLVKALLAWPLPVRGGRGYNYAEVTAGGVPLDEIDPSTMESRKCPGLHLIGEILDVDGRLGGFNFQWAWSSAWVAASSLDRTAPMR
jgi:hypothetical protein